MQKIRLLSPIALILVTIAGPTTPAAEAAAMPAVDVAAIRQQAPRLDPRALTLALADIRSLMGRGARVRSDVVGVIDYSLPSTEPRFWVFDLAHNSVLFHELVAHGKNSGGNLATHFSNAPESRMSSLGAFLTGNTYMGEHGLSLRLLGLEKGVNDNLLSRAIVIHSAKYVNAGLAQHAGRIGRSWGCPAVRPEISKQLIETLKDGALILAYYPAQTPPASQVAVAAGATRRSALRLAVVPAVILPMGRAR